MDRVYVPYKLSGKVIDWKQKWFYLWNHNATLPVITLGPPTIRSEWNKEPADDSQIQDLLEWIAGLKKEGITKAAVVMGWMKRRIQPLQSRMKFGFEYQGNNYPSHYSTAEISDREALRQVQRVLDNVEKVPHIPYTSYVANPPKEVH